MSQPTDGEQRWVDGDLESGADSAEDATAARPTDTGRGDRPDQQPAERTITEE